MSIERLDALEDAAGIVDRRGAAWRQLRDNEHRSAKDYELYNLLTMAHEECAAEIRRLKECEDASSPEEQAKGEG